MPWHWQRAKASFTCGCASIQETDGFTVSRHCSRMGGDLKRQENVKGVNFK